MRILALLRDLGLMGLRLCLPGKAGLDGLVEGIHLDDESVEDFRHVGSRSLGILGFRAKAKDCQ